MSLTPNEIILIATPWLVGIVACSTAYISYTNIMRRRAARLATSNDHVAPAGDLWLQLTAEESAVVRKMLEKDLLEKKESERSAVATERRVANR